MLWTLARTWYRRLARTKQRLLFEIVATLLLWIRRIMYSTVEWTCLSRVGRNRAKILSPSICAIYLLFLPLHSTWSYSRYHYQLAYDRHFSTVLCNYLFRSKAGYPWYDCLLYGAYRYHCEQPLGKVTDTFCWHMRITSYISKDHSRLKSKKP